MPSFAFAVSVLITHTSVALADPTQYITFKSLARDAEDTQLVNVIESELVQINLERRRFLYNLEVKLAGENASSKFELAQALVRLLAAQFRLVSNESTSKVKEFEAHMWHLRAEWARTDSPGDPAAMARLAVGWRTEVLAIAKTGLLESEGIANQLTQLRRASDEMITSGAIDKIEHNYFVTLDRGGQRLLKRMRDGLAQAATSLAEAEADLNRYAR